MLTFQEFEIKTNPLVEAINVEIKKKSTNEPNVSDRHITYDLHVNGKYHTTHTDVIDAMDHKKRIEKAGKIVK